MTAAMTCAEKLACIRRELAMREKVYPRWIEQRRMTAAKAAAEIATMRAIAEDYEILAADERLL
jgi:hypothetical protein